VGPQPDKGRGPRRCRGPRRRWSAAGGRRGHGVARRPAHPRPAV